MSKYVVLNFEDRHGDTGKGAADSTVAALKLRYEKHKQHGAVKALFVGKHSVVEHRCVEMKGASPGFTTDADRIGKIRADCKNAGKIYVVAHGDPRTTEICYTNDPHGIGVVRLARYTQLGAFLKQVLPAKCTVALVMCYGARCAHYQRAQVNHSQAMDLADLRTSFAYQLFYGLAQVSDIKLTAVTGKIQHDATTGRALVEHEDVIDENMEFAEAAKAQTVSKGPLLDTFKRLQGTPDGLGKMNAAAAKFRANPATPVVTDYDRYGKDLVAWENSGGLAMKKRVEDAQQNVRAARQKLVASGQEETMHKFGKFIYTYRNSVLRIVSKYGTKGGDGVAAGTVLYEGPMV